MRKIILRQYEQALQIHKGKQDVLEKDALILLEQEKIEADNIKALFE